MFPRVKPTKNDGHHCPLDVMDALDPKFLVRRNVFWVYPSVSIIFGPMVSFARIRVHPRKLADRWTTLNFSFRTRNFDLRAPISSSSGTIPMSGRANAPPGSPCVERSLPVLINPLRDHRPTVTSRWTQLHSRSPLRWDIAAFGEERRWDWSNLLCKRNKLWRTVFLP